MMFLNKKYKIVIFSALLIFFFIFGNTNPVFADSALKTETYDRNNEEEPLDFEELLNQLILRHENQSAVLDKAETMLERVQTRIEEFQNEGKETGFLETNLTEISEIVHQAQQYHDLAGQILNRKPGFDENGNLLDEDMAKSALSNATKLLQNCKETLRAAHEQAETAKEDFILSFSSDQEQLEELFQKAVNKQDSIRNFLDNSEEKLSFIADKLEEMEKAGQDVSEYQNTLEELTRILDECNSLFMKCQDLLNQHPGFDSNLQVEDYDLAKATIVSLRDTAQELREKILLARQISKVNQHLFRFDFFTE